MKAHTPKNKKHLPTVSVGLDKRKHLANGKYNAAVTIAFNYKFRYYHITTDGQKLTLAPGDLRSRDIKSLLDTEKERVKQIISELPVFTFEGFEAAYYSDIAEQKDDLISALRTRAKELYPKQLKTAIGYETTANSVESFTEGKRLPFHRVTVKWLNDFESYLMTPYIHGKRLKQGRTSTTVGIYMRNIRAVVRPHLTGSDYPFGSGKYEIPGSRNIKKALTIQEVALIYNYDAPVGSKIAYYRDLWILSYLCNGANFKDMARLRYRDIDGENITFIRSKTSNTKRSRQSKVVVPVTVEIARIIDRWSSQGTPTDYILPILQPGLTPKQELDRVQTAVKNTNREVRRIAANCGITKDVTTYAARHSFSTILMQSGATVEYISKALGHSNVGTTANYLSDFDQETKLKYAKALTAFTAH